MFNSTFCYAAVTEQYCYIPEDVYDPNDFVNNITFSNAKQSDDAYEFA
jgi:hypothetical protein